jgi:hypothetical protein
MAERITEYDAVPVDNSIIRSRRATDTLEDIVSSARDLATKIPATIGRAIEKAVSAGEHAILVKVDDETLRKIEMLVRAEICKTRPEAMVFLATEGIKSQQALFDRIEAKEAEIERLKSELRNISPAI